MKKTENNTGLTLNIAFNYGGRPELVRAMKNIAQEIKENKNTDSTLQHTVLD